MPPSESSSEEELFEEPFEEFDYDSESEEATEGPEAQEVADTSSCITEEVKATTASDAAASGFVAPEQTVARFKALLGVLPRLKCFQRNEGDRGEVAMGLQKAMDFLGPYGEALRAEDPVLDVPVYHLSLVKRALFRAKVCASPSLWRKIPNKVTQKHFSEAVEALSHITSVECLLDAQQTLLHLGSCGDPDESFLGSRILEEKLSSESGVSDQEELKRLLSVIQFSFEEKELLHLPSEEMALAAWFLEASRERTQAVLQDWRKLRYTSRPAKRHLAWVQKAGEQGLLTGTRLQDLSSFATSCESLIFTPLPCR